MTMNQTVRRADIGIECRDASIADGSLDVTARTFDVVWTTGAAVRRYDYFEGREFLEELSLDPAHVRMGRLQSGAAPLLDTHNAWSLAGQIGVVESARLVGGRGVATVRLSARDEVASIVQDIADGIIRNVSVGYARYKVERIAPARDGELWTYRVIDWEPMELSFVPAGADAGAGRRESTHTPMQGRTFSCEFTDAAPAVKEQRNMSDANTPGAGGDEQQRAIQAERERAAEIRRAVRTARLPEGFADDLVGRGVPLERARDLILRRWHDETEQYAPSAPNGRMPQIGPAAGGDGEPVRLMAEALAQRFGGVPASDRARSVIHMRVPDMARELLERRGVSTTMLGAPQLIERAISTSDLPTLLQMTGERVLRNAYEASPGLKRVFRKATLRDFRARTAVSFSESPALQKVNEGGEYRHTAVSEGKEVYSLVTHGIIVRVTRQALVNDDLGAFAQLPAAFGRSAVNKENDVLVDVLANNGNMSDGVPLFHANHGNLVPGANLQISVNTLDMARKLMRLQKGLDGSALSIEPRYLIVPAALETAAFQYTSTSFVPAQASSVSPFAGKLEVVVDARLDAKSTSRWYLAADPAAIDTIEYAYLEGTGDGPEFFSHDDFDVDATSFKVRLDFGAGAIDWRGLVRAGD